MNNNGDSAAEDTILEIRNASVTFDLSRGVSRVLDDVDLDVKRNEVLGVVGESGSGKSMLANALVDAVPEEGDLDGSIRYYPPSGEEIEILDQDPEGLRRLRWEEISIVSQSALSSFNPTMEIRTHFEETLDNHDYDMLEGMERAGQLLSDLYLDPERVLDSYPHELSGGMRQRALIALSLVLEPEVVVMDEPTAALDLLMQRSILNLIDEIQDRYDLTVVFITHDLAQLSDLADRLAVMYAFEIAEVGPTEEILDDSAHPYTRKLLRSTPDLEGPLDQMDAIEGSAPDPVNVPEGCSFHPRCPMATDRCREVDPELYDVTGEHTSACHYWDDVDEQVDLRSPASSGDASPASSPTLASERGGSPLLSLDDVSIHFEETEGVVARESKTVHAVDEVTLDVYEEDVVALVGESGCGKTTLGKASIALQRPTGGEIRYRGTDIWEAHDDRGSLLSRLTGGIGAPDPADADIEFSEIRRALQIVHQDPASALNPNKRVVSTLQKPLKKWNAEMDKQARERRIYSLLELVGMAPAEDYADRYPHQLSGGEQQRVALIRALLMNPDMILADEAISALDVSLRVETMDLLLELQDMFGTSFLFISHDLSNARYLAEKAGGRIAVMYLGEIVEIGPVESIISNPEHPYTEALRWATPDLDKEEIGTLPMRRIDIPDATNPPSGCRFHTRCPEAREACTAENPDPIETEDGKEVACFRADPNHEYWESEPLESETTDSRIDPTGNAAAGESDD
ncbi:peptide ABC transporter ATPase [Halosimplex carlsbadense 2-9-1]|uniref:Peptide ABC transporter ATPase n=1 Tax=Halosimplex carlsbadense 2-9-1 TaxID=797114 RepID=M0CC68_9EURY|nr:ABC transporter ATP-binding protein [Halosimplex carlsbadense]ELZ19942.1 peptide ABC transporter ATPase [Halosimplex carlsbadense 2-9-1]